MSLKEVEDFINQGNLDKASRLLEKVQKKGVKKTEDKVFLSRILLRLGDYHKSIKVLGKRVKQSELTHLDPARLSLHVQICFGLNMIGAKYSAMKYLEQVIEAAETSGVDLTAVYSDYYRNVAGMYYSNDYFAETVEFCERYFEENDEVSFFTEVIYCQALSGIGESARAARLLADKCRDVKSKNKKAIGLAHLAELFYYNGDIDVAQDAIKSSLKRFNRDLRTKDLAHAYRVSGIIASYVNEFDKAEEHLKLSYEIGKENHFQPYAQLKTYYYLWKLNENNLNLKQLIALRCYGVFSPYSYMAGKNKKYGPEKMHASLEKMMSKNLNDCWVIRKDEIKPATYKEVILKCGNKNILDLNSSRIITNKLKLLSDEEKRCLNLIIGAGDIGINEWAVIDYVYLDEMIDFESAKERFKKLVAKLKRMSFPISRKKNYYFYGNLKSNWTYILPMSRDGGDILNHLKVVCPRFTQKKVEELYEINSAKASRLVRGWKTMGLVIEDASESIREFIVL